MACMSVGEDQMRTEERGGTDDDVPVRMPSKDSRFTARLT